MATLLDHPEQEGQYVCLPWNCTWAHHCDLNMEHGGIVIIHYFHPQFTGEHCKFYAKRAQEANHVCQ